MKNEQIFIKNGYFYIMKKDDNESYEDFIERGNFIVCQQSKNLNELNKINTYSKIWINHRKMNCEYSKEIMNQLQIYEKNM